MLNGTQPRHIMDKKILDYADALARSVKVIVRCEEGRTQWSLFCRQHRGLFPLDSGSFMVSDFPD